MLLLRSYSRLINIIINLHNLCFIYFVIIDDCFMFIFNYLWLLMIIFWSFLKSAKKSGRYWHLYIPLLLYTGNSWGKSWFIQRDEIFSIKVTKYCIENITCWNFFWRFHGLGTMKQIYIFLIMLAVFAWLWQRLMFWQLLNGSSKAW